MILLEKSVPVQLRHDIFFEVVHAHSLLNQRGEGSEKGRKE